MVNEAALVLLEERIVETPDEVDLGMITGTGFPPFRGGLLRFKNGQFTRYGKPEGLPDDVICQILSDDHDNLWFGSQRGIFRVAKASLNTFARGEIKSIPCALYGRYDGLPSLECSGAYQPSAWRGNDGRLWFTTVKGAVSIQPLDGFS